MITPEEAADALLHARSSGTAIPPFTESCPDLSERWGYAVQDLDRARRLEEGEAVLGAKLGLTSRAKQRTMGVERPVVGFLTTGMSIDDPTNTSSGLIHPRCEPEIAFRLGKSLDRPLSFSEAAGIVDAFAIAIEVIDSRYEGFRFKLPDVLADNTSAAGLLLGEWVPAPDLDGLSSAVCRLFVDEALVQEGRAAAVLGHPLHSLVHLSQHIASRGYSLPAGSVVLSGSMTDAVALKPGSTHRAEVDGFSPLALLWPLTN